MNLQETYTKVSEWMENHKEEMVRDIEELVAIPSISGEAEQNAPFGNACLEALRTMLRMGKRYGFHTENYDNYVGSIGSENKDWKNLIGFWNHLDVVPAGDGWESEPFTPVRKGNYLIGRGVEDNKGPAVGILYAMRCIRELGLPVKHELCLFVGCDEEKGMRDVEYYTAHYPTPAMSMTADCGFPVCFGEKGILEGRILSDQPLSPAVVAVSGGNAGNIVPDEASMVLKKDAIKAEEVERLRNMDMLELQEEEGLLKLRAKGVAAHSAAPDGGVNAISVLCEAVCRADILSEQDRRIMEGIRIAVAGNYGEAEGVDYEDEVSGRLTCAGTMLRMEKGRISLFFNIRYSITADIDSLTEKMTAFWKERGFGWTTERDSRPNYFDREHPAVNKLTEIFNELTGQNTEPYVMGGGTYARKLPNAFGFGIGNMPDKDDAQHPAAVKKGHGGAHEPDEMLDCDKLTEAMKIYVMAILALHDVELESRPGNSGQRIHLPK